MNRFTVREHISSILVATLSTAFGVCLLQATGALATMIRADDVTGSSDIVAVFLGVVAIVFMVIAIYVGAIVTSNTFATIIAGRTRTIALYRLIGSSASAQRRAVAREGLTVGLIGVVLGTLIGTGITSLSLGMMMGLGMIADLPYRLADPVLLFPMVSVVLTTWLASWVGSRKVLSVSPMQATGAAQELTLGETVSRRGRNTLAISLFVVGVCVLLLGVAIGLVSPFGVLVSMVGGFVSFTGLVLGAHLVMPPALRLVGRLFGRGASARLAAENAVRYPERSSRTTIGLVIGVTLVTMFAVAIASYARIIQVAQASDPQYYSGIDEMFTVTIVVFSVLTGFSALIAAVGMVNNLSLSVLQRTRELGLLRALGFTATQIRGMILAESAQLTFAAVLVGLVLGTFYGWAGAQSMFGSIWGGPGLIAPAVPPVLVAIVVASATVLTAVAAVAPTRRATRVSPVTALAAD